MSYFDPSIVDTSLVTVLSIPPYKTSNPNLKMARLIYLGEPLNLTINGRAADVTQPPNETVTDYILPFKPEKDGAELTKLSKLLEDENYEAMWESLGIPDAANYSFVPSINDDIIKLKLKKRQNGSWAFTYDQDPLQVKQNETFLIKVTPQYWFATNTVDGVITKTYGLTFKLTHLGAGPAPQATSAVSIKKKK